MVALANKRSMTRNEDYQEGWRDGWTDCYESCEELLKVAPPPTRGDVVAAYMMVSLTAGLIGFLIGVAA